MTLATCQDDKTEQPADVSRMIQTVCRENARSRVSREAYLANDEVRATTNILGANRPCSRSAHE